MPRFWRVFAGCPGICGELWRIWGIPGRFGCDLTGFAGFVGESRSLWGLLPFSYDWIGFDPGFFGCCGPSFVRKRMANCEKLPRFRCSDMVFAVV
jgi:hypothetical protein